MRESVKEQKEEKKNVGEKISTLNFFLKFKMEMKNMISRHLKFIKCLEEKKRHPIVYHGEIWEYWK